MAKKLIALFVLVATLFVFASCSMPPKLNLEKAKDNLEDNGYVVMYDDDGEGSQVKRLRAVGEDGEELEIIEFATFKAARLYYQELKLQQKMGKKMYKLYVKQLKLEIKTAKYEVRKFDDDADYEEDDIDDLKDSLEEFKENYREEMKEYKFGILGKVVWFGDADALKDSKRS